MMTWRQIIDIIIMMVLTAYSETGGTDFCSPIRCHGIIDIITFNSYSLQYYSFRKGKMGSDS